MNSAECKCGPVTNSISTYIKILIALWVIFDFPVRVCVFDLRIPGMSLLCLYYLYYKNMVTNAQTKHGLKN